jgi:hypothetical protein
LCAWSRHDETPREQVIELEPDGRDYSVVEDVGDEEFQQGWEMMHLVLSEAIEKLTRPQIVKKWPAPRPPSEVTLWRWLERAVERRLVLQEGQGRKGDPYRYWLPGRELPWYPDPLESLGF